MLGTTFTKKSMNSRDNGRVKLIWNTNEAVFSDAPRRCEGVEPRIFEGADPEHVSRLLHLSQGLGPAMRSAIQTAGGCTCPRCGLTVLSGLLQWTLHGEDLEFAFASLREFDATLDTIRTTMAQQVGYERAVYESGATQGGHA